MAAASRTAVLLLVLMGLCLSSRHGAEAQTTSAEVIVVGAGMAGMTAAKKLVAKLGAANVIVLEGRNRVGGRCWTRTLATADGTGAKADLGAGWIHGIVGNPITSLANTAGVALASKITNYDNSWLFLPDGSEATSTQETRWENLYAAFETYLEDQQWNAEDAGTDPGLLFYANKFIAARGLSGMDKLAFQFMLNTEIEHEYAAPLKTLSTFFDYDTAQDGDDKFVTGGYQRLVEYLAKGVDVRLGHKVTKIDTSSTTRITLTVAGKGTFTAKRVVVAVPLGVLQKGVITFAPSGLPAANQKALSQLGVGLLNKLIMVFDKVFWEDSAIEILNRIAPAGNGAWSETYSLYPIVGKPVLVAFNAADYAWQLEAKTDAQIKDEYMAVLRTQFDNVPEPRSYVVTKWGTDPFTYGSYSYTKAPVAGQDGYNSAHLDCARPMAGSRVFFAGEHTRIDCPATTNGAYLSGNKAACDLLKASGRTC